MKKLVIPLLLLLGLALYSSFATAPTFRYFTTSTDAVTVDVDWKVDSIWEVIDSLVVTADDTAAIFISISGIAVMDYNDKLYLAFSSKVGGALSTSLPNIDSVLVAPKFERGAQHRIPFVFDYALCDTLIGGSFFAGAEVDTIYFLAACGGSSNKEQVFLEDVECAVMVHEEDDCADGTYQ